MKHLLSIADLSRADIERMHGRRRELRGGRRSATSRRCPTLRGRTVVNLFYESSTRTSSSFELAAKRLSADLVSVRSSRLRGRQGRVAARHDRDAVRLRPGRDRDPRALGRRGRRSSPQHTTASVVNAGDGKHEHPSQALLDVYTLRRRLGSLDGRRHLDRRRRAAQPRRPLQHPRLHADGRAGHGLRAADADPARRRGARLRGRATTSTASPRPTSIYALRMQHERMGDVLRALAARVRRLLPDRQPPAAPAPAADAPRAGEPRRRALGGGDRVAAGADRRPGREPGWWCGWRSSTSCCRAAAEGAAGAGARSRRWSSRREPARFPRVRMAARDGGARDAAPARRAAARPARRPRRRPRPAGARRRGRRDRAPGALERARGMRGGRGRGPDGLPRLRRPARPPAHARARGRGGPRVRHARGGGRRLLPRCSRCRTPSRSSTRRRCCARSRSGPRVEARRAGRLPGRDHEGPVRRRADRDGGAGARRARPASATTASRSRTPAGCARRFSTSGSRAACWRCTRRIRRCPAHGVMHEGAVSTTARPGGHPVDLGEHDDRARRRSSRATRAGASTSCTCPPPSRSRRSSAARAAGVEVTAEVTPHHLTLTDEAVRSLDPRFKMNPPLRAAARPRGADRGPALGRDRLHRDRPRAAFARGEGGAVRGGADGRDRARDGVRGPLHRPRAARACSASTLLVERMTAGGAPVRAAGRRRSPRARRPTSAWSTSRRAWTVGEAGYESRSENSCFAGRELRGRVLMTVARGRGRLPRAGLRDPARGRPGGTVAAPGARVKLDRSRAALVVVDVQEAFRPAVLDFERVAAQRRDARAGRADPRAARCWSPSSTRRASAARCPRWPSTSTASSRSRRSASARSTRTVSRRAARRRPRPGAAVRDRVPRVREPDRRGPARRRASRSTSRRTRSRSRTAENRALGLHKMERSGAVADQRRDRAVRAAARRPARRSSRKSRAVK